MSAKCITFTAPQQVELCQIKEEPLAADEVRIATRKSLISTGTELTALLASYPPESTWEKCFAFPFKAGYANVGEVVEVGKKVKTLTKGMRVATETPHSDYVTYKEASCHPIPDELDDNVATFFVIAEISIQAVRRARLCMGESVVIYGLGLLGQLAGILARQNGAFPVIGVDISENRLELAKQSEFDAVVNGSSQNVFEEVNNITKGRMADCVFEVTANTSIFANEMDLLHEQGKFVILSSPQKETVLDFHDYVNRPSHTIIGAHNYSHPAVETYDNPWTIRRDVELFFDLLKSNRISVEHLITDNYSAIDAPKAYKKLIEDRSKMMGVILDWTN